MTFWLAWLHLTNFQILLVSFRSNSAHWSTSRHLQSIFHHFRQFPSLLTTRYFGPPPPPPRSGPNADFQPKWKSLFLDDFGTVWTKKTGKPDLSRKRIWVSLKPSLGSIQWGPYRKPDQNRETGLSRKIGRCQFVAFCTLWLTPCKESEKTNEPILRKVGNWQTDGQADMP